MTDLELRILEAGGAFGSLRYVVNPTTYRARQVIRWTFEGRPCGLTVGSMLTSGLLVLRRISPNRYIAEPACGVHDPVA